jgi:hypothetical protein
MGCSDDVLVAPSWQNGGDLGSRVLVGVCCKGCAHLAAVGCMWAFSQFWTKALQKACGYLGGQQGNFVAWAGYLGTGWSSAGYGYVGSHYVT